MAAEFAPIKYRRFLQRVFYLAVILGLAAVVIGQYAK
jgi:hypothetical protein